MTLNGGASQLQDIVLLVDELDMSAPTNELSFNGAEHFMKAKFFYGCSATSLTEADKAAFECTQLGATFASMAGPKKLILPREVRMINTHDAIKEINNLRVQGHKLVVVCTDMREARLRLDQLKSAAKDHSKNYLLLDPEAKLSDINKVLPVLTDLD